MFLSTDSGYGSAYRTTPADLSTHVAWQEALSAKLPAGSSIKAELVRCCGLSALLRVECVAAC